MNEPCDFVKLVLQRMDSNPDEFEHYGRWNSLCESLERYAGAWEGSNSTSGRNVLWAYDQFEIDLMLAKYREVYRDREYKSMLKNLLVGADVKTSGLMRDAKAMSSAGNNINAVYQNITPQQLFANSPAHGVVGHTGVTIANTATTTANPQIRSMIDDAIEAKMQGFKRG